MKRANLGRAARALSLVAVSWGAAASAKADTILVVGQTGNESIVSTLVSLGMSASPSDVFTNGGSDSTLDFGPFDQVWFVAGGCSWDTASWPVDRFTAYAGSGRSLFLFTEFFGPPKFAGCNTPETATAVLAGTLNIPVQVIASDNDTPGFSDPGFCNEPVEVPPSAGVLRCPNVISSVSPTSCSGNLTGVPGPNMLRRRVTSGLAAGAIFGPSRMQSGAGYVMVWPDSSGLPTVPMLQNILAFTQPTGAGSTCRYCESAAVCDDGSPCTVDSCASTGLCTNTPVAEGSPGACAAGLVCSGEPTNTCVVPLPTLTEPIEGSTTTSTTPTVAGTCVAGAAVTVAQGASTVCTASCAAAGTFSCTPSSPMSYGAQAITARQTIAGSTSATTPARNFTIVRCSDSSLTGTDSGCSASAPHCRTTGAGSPVCEPCLDTSTLGTDLGCAAATPFCVPGSDGSNVCVACTSDASCSDGNACTTDTCSAAGACVFTPVAAGSPGTCTMGFLCSGAPTSMCMLPAPSIATPTEGSVTSSATPAITGTCAAGGVVTIRRGSTTVCTATCTAAGGYGCTPTSPLAPGPQAITATQTLAGTTSAATPVRSFFVLGPPSITAPTGGSVTSPTPAIVGACAPGATVTVREGDATVCVATCAEGAFSCTPTTPFTPGSHTITATQTLSGTTSAATPDVTFTVASCMDTSADGVDMGCADATPYCVGTGAAARCVQCTGASQCDDGGACTVDGCSAAGACVTTPVEAGLPGTCTDGLVCSGGPSSACVTCADTERDGTDAGCSVGTPHCVGAGATAVCVACTTATHCDDGNPCTEDACSALGACSNAGLDAGDPGTCEGGAVCSGPSGTPTPNACVECVANAQCSELTPFCDVSGGICVPCASDFGREPVPACGEENPLCLTSGESQGACGRCEVNADCAGNPAGELCDVESGRCGTRCTVDADCESAEWCPDGRVCAPRRPNGEPVPSEGPANGQCTEAIGLRTCLSGVCFEPDDLCGLPNFQPCSSPGVCRSAICAPNGECGECASDDDCASNDCDEAAGRCRSNPDAGPTDAGPADGGAGAADAGADGGPSLALSGGGCGCMVRSTGSNAGLLGLIGVLGLVVARRRRRGAAARAERKLCIHASGRGGARRSSTVVRRSMLSSSDARRPVGAGERHEPR